MMIMMDLILMGMGLLIAQNHLRFLSHLVTLDLMELRIHLMKERVMESGMVII